MRGVVCVIAVALLGWLLPADAARTLGTLRFEPCNLAAGTMVESVDAQCTTLEVPENRATPGGRTIRLAIGWVPSEDASAARDPVLLLAGGPGQGARAAYPVAALAFAEVLKHRHVILVDQRGTGGSHPLVCRDESGASTSMDESSTDDPALVKNFAQQCLTALDADPRYYTTSDAVTDLEAVRQALGAPTVNLLGVSYGTRVALEYLRRYPQSTRTVVLDGVVPPELILGSEHAKNLEASLARQLARCEQTPQCTEKFGSPRLHLDALFARLRTAPVDVDYRHPLTGERHHASFTATHLATLVRLFAYDPRLATMLPLGLAEASQGRFDTLMAQAQMLSSMLGGDIAHAMQLSVICTEDAALLTSDPADAATTMGNTLVDLTVQQCSVWPRGVLPEDFHTPVRSDKPVLLVSGEFDPVTPPRYGEQVAKHLPQARHLVLRGRGHNVTPLGCMPRLLATFFDTADARGLQAACLERLDYRPPFSGYYGWEP